MYQSSSSQTLCAEMAIYDLEKHRIPNLPEAGYYVPDFISTTEEELILSEVSAVPLPKWTVLTRRRLLSIPSQLGGTSRDTLLGAPLPKWLSEPIVGGFTRWGVFANSLHQSPNHVLVNEYCPGQGIMPHEDGPTYCPITATVSLAGHTVLDVYKKNEEGEKASNPTWRILQEPRSLLVTTGCMYKDTLHGIAEVEMDEKLGPKEISNWAMLGDLEPYKAGSAARSLRTSLTYRDVFKVAKLGGALRFMNRR